jgi:hypothetical protein
VTFLQRLLTSGAVKTAQVVAAITCHYCSRAVHPDDVRKMGESIVMCFQCLERHKKAVETFEVPSHCQGC